MQDYELRSTSTPRMVLSFPLVANVYSTIGSHGMHVARSSPPPAVMKTLRKILVSCAGAASSLGTPSCSVASFAPSL